MLDVYKIVGPLIVLALTILVSVVGDAIGRSQERRRRLRLAGQSSPPRITG